MSSSKPSSKYSDQQILMAALPYILLDYNNNDKNTIRDVPSHYLKSKESFESENPIERTKKIDSDSLAKILRLNNIEVSSLVPKIQFWKVYQNKDGKFKEIYIPYSYDARNYIESVFGNKENRGDDVGIKGVSFTYDNQNPAVAESLLGCRVDFVFSSPDALTLVRQDGFRFVDLFSWPGTQSNDKIDRGQYDIILKVGYELDGATETVSPQVKDALRGHETMVRLGMIGYDLTFSPNGILNASIDYSSANIDYFSDNRNEVLGLKKLATIPKTEKDKVQAEKAKKNAAYMAASEKFLASSDEMTPEEYLDGLDELDKIANEPADSTKEAIDLQSLYGNIQEYMVKSNMIRKFDATVLDEIFSGDYSFKTNPCGSENSYKEDSASQLIPVGNGDPKTLPSAIRDYKNWTREVSYFTFGDLIDAVLATNPELVEELKDRKFAFLLDNVGYQFMKGDHVSVFNIGKLPIAQRSYDEWFKKNVISKKIKVFSLMAFMKSVLLNFVASILTSTTNDKVGSDYKPSLTRELVNVPDGLEDNKEIHGFTATKKKDGSSYFGKTAEKSLYEYYIVYDQTYYNDILSNDMEIYTDADRYYINIARGIPHFYIGADKGLLKTFNFTKSNIGEGIAVARNLEPGNAFQELWSIFNIEAEFIGNNLMSVGSLIYLDPTISGLGSPYKKGTVANRMGLGGYYMVETVRHTYYPRWTTSVTATVIVPSSQKQSYDSKIEFIYF